jgi:hypothetical protein
MHLVPLISVIIADDSAGPPIYPCGGGCCCSLLLSLVFWKYIIYPHFIEEWLRGRKRWQTDEEVLDSLPKKRQVMFKGEKVPEWKIAARSKATKAMLKFLAYTDNWFERKYIADVADEAFRLVKEAVENRSVRGLDRRLTPDCLQEVEEEIRKARKEHERHVFERVEVTDVTVLHVEAPAGKDRHTFTALVSARSKDFFADDETDEVIRGDRKTYAYQEFWTFRRTEKRWVVELIRPPTDVEAVLESKNVLAPIDLEEFSKDADPEFLKEVAPR